MTRPPRASALTGWDAVADEVAAGGVRVGSEPEAEQVPAVRVSDVLLHGLRHLKFQIGPWGDAEIAAAMDRNWRRHLHALKPALATMYSELIELQRGA